MAATKKPLTGTTEFSFLSVEQAMELVRAMQDEVKQSVSYCERYGREKVTRERLQSALALAQLLEEEEQ